MNVFIGLKIIWKYNRHFIITIKVFMNKTK